MIIINFKINKCKNTNIFKPHFEKKYILVYNFMTDHFFVNTAFDVTQSANLYAQTIDVSDVVYDYIISIDINTLDAAVPANAWTSMNQLFSVRKFTQNNPIENTAGENTADVTLTADLAALNTLLYSHDATTIASNMSSVLSKPAYSTLITEKRLLGLRFLEVVATKVFGHAKARAAIANDTDFYHPLNTTGSLIQQIITGVNSSLHVNRNDVFNSYVAFDRIQDNVNTLDDADVGSDDLFNFDNTEWRFPIYFKPTLYDIGGDATMNELNNGPDVGGNRLLNGNMNIPILVRFFKS
jgi:hypothetical protein